MFGFTPAQTLARLLKDIYKHILATSLDQLCYRNSDTPTQDYFSPTRPLANIKTSRMIKLLFPYYVTLQLVLFL